MSDCSNICVLSSEASDPIEFCQAKTVKARKQHTCCECRGAIQPGESYERVAGEWDGEFLTFKTCSLCVEIRGHFSCGRGWNFEMVWETLRDDLFYQLKFECLEGLSIPAKEKVLAEWRKWKGLDSPKSPALEAPAGAAANNLE